ncbi:hypothetical protein AN401_07075 [Zobellella denitrificans]|uniref:Uncharacterized protein n=1 Tax=Zobellella denitrificans TaxID=347534 RepID=A0A291HN46_9GAMM|nr:hypothetical protein [Zobellella denitrificans]ATG73646.1 hypothetical protein AN401_07075 [Zobellella denitrificans]
MDTKVEVTVRSYHDGYRTSRVEGMQASCAIGPEAAVLKLARKLFTHYRVELLESYPHGTNGNIVGRWEIAEE